MVLLQLSRGGPHFLPLGYHCRGRIPQIAVSTLPGNWQVGECVKALVLMMFGSIARSPSECKKGQRLSPPKLSAHGSDASVPLTTMVLLAKSIGLSDKTQRQESEHLIDFCGV